MDLIKDTLSWSTFFVSIIVLAVVWLLSTRTQIGRNMISRETDMTLDNWARLLLVIAIALFILVNPVLHLIEVVVIGGLYKLLIVDKILGSDFLPGGDSQLSETNTNVTANNSNPLSLVCEVSDEQSMLTSKSRLDQCLFSFPYVKDNPLPHTHYIDGRYHVSVKLTSDQYLASLLEYLRHSGFDTKLKN